MNVMKDNIVSMELGDYIALRDAQTELERIKQTAIDSRCYSDNTRRSPRDIGEYVLNEFGLKESVEDDNI